MRSRSAAADRSDLHAERRLLRVRSFTYTISDGNGGTATATVNVTVTAANDTPVATNDAYAALEDTPLVFGAPGVLANDGGLGDGPLTLTVVGVPVGGGVALANDGSFTLTPTANFTGAASFQYQVQDVDGETATGSVSITVSAVNDAPDGTDTTVTAIEDSTYTFTLGNFGFNDVDLGDAIDRRAHRFDIAARRSDAAARRHRRIRRPDHHGGGYQPWQPRLHAGRKRERAGYASFTFSVTRHRGPPGRCSTQCRTR